MSSRIAFTFPMCEGSPTDIVAAWFVDNLDISVELAHKAAHKHPFFNVYLQCAMDLDTGDIVVYGANN